MCHHRKHGCRPDYHLYLTLFLHNELIVCSRDSFDLEYIETKSLERCAYFRGIIRSRNTPHNGHLTARFFHREMPATAPA